MLTASIIQMVIIVEKNKPFMSNFTAKRICDIRLKLTFNNFSA